MFINNTQNFNKDFYSILGINENCNLEDIKSTYRILAKRYHPDLNPNNPDAENKFKQVVEAYEVLSNSNKKSDYDFYRRQKQSSPTSGFQYKNKSYSNFDEFSRKAEEHDRKFWEDLAKSQREEQRRNQESSEFQYRRNQRLDEDYYNIQKDYYETHKVFEETRKTFYKTEPIKVRVKHGSDIKIKVDLNEKEFINGVDKQIIIEKFVKCGICNGTGSQLKRESWVVCSKCFGVGTNCRHCNYEGVTIEKKCNTCNGEGRMNKKIMERIIIPMNSRTGQRYKYSKKGDYGIRNNGTGSLIVEIGKLSKTNFDIYKNDIMFFKTINIDTAIFGGIIEVNNHEKRFKVNVNPGIKEGDIYKIENMGILNEKNDNSGDFFIKFKIIR